MATRKGRRIAVVTILVVTLLCDTLGWLGRWHNRFMEEGRFENEPG